MSDYRKWIKKVVALASKLGWKVDQKNHYKFKSPNGGTTVIAPCTPSSYNAMWTVRRDFRKAGLELDMSSL